MNWTIPIRVASNFSLRAYGGFTLLVLQYIADLQKQGEEGRNLLFGDNVSSYFVAQITIFPL